MHDNFSSNSDKKCKIKNTSKGLTRLANSNAIAWHKNPENFASSAMNHKRPGENCYETCMSDFIDSDNVKEKFYDPKITFMTNFRR